MTPSIIDIKAYLKLIKQSYTDNDSNISWTDNKPLDYFKYNQDVNRD